MLGQIFCVLLLVVQVFSASNVAVLFSTPVPAYETDVERKLAPFFNVTGISVVSTTPTLAQLQPFDAVLVYSDSTFFNSVALGNVLADYVDLGKGVVVATFAFSSQLSLGGRFSTGGYYLLTLGTQTQGTRQTLVVVDPASPILAGVRSFDGGSSSYRIQSTFAANAHRVATWSDGLPLIATGQVGRSMRADINFYPPSSDARTDFWTSTSDGALILANALKYVSGVNASCSSYSNCSTCTTASCQWCLDTNTCQNAPNFTCGDRIAVPGDCPHLVCPSLSTCNTCLGPDVIARCSWCLDNNTCVAKDAPCRGELNDPRFCSAKLKQQLEKAAEKVSLFGSASASASASAPASAKKDKKDD